MGKTKTQRRKKIHMGIRTKIKGSSAIPRLNVFRSNKFIYAQVIDDLKGHTLAAASSREGSIAKSGTKSDQAKAVGKLLAERSGAASISRVRFDRAGYLYHGRVKALAEGAREGGLNF